MTAERLPIDPHTERITSSEGLVGSAAIRALMEARWEAADLLGRRAPGAACDLLRAHAAELALSPLGRDQVMSVALDAAADDVEQGRPPLAAGVLFFLGRRADHAARLEVQRTVFAALAERAAAEREADEATVRLETELRRMLAGALAIAELSGRLLEDARLHRQLWDDPRIPAAPGVRLRLLLSVPRLVDRARALDPMRLRAVRDLLRWPGVS